MEQYSLLDVARMFLSIPLKQDIKIDSVELKITYRGLKNIKCIYKEILGVLENKK